MDAIDRFFLETPPSAFFAVAAFALLMATGRLRQFVIWLDQGLNVVIGSGYADETLSAYFHRRGDWRERAVNAIFFWQRDERGIRNHCERAWMSEFARNHMPREYRA